MKLGLLTALVVTAAPYAVLGPAFFREDWTDLHRVLVCGPITCPDHEISTRPIMVLLWDAMYGTFGNHPLPTYLLLVAVNALVTVALYRVLRNALSPLRSALVVLLWIAFPTHWALLHWATTIHISLSLLFLLLGIQVLIGEERRARRSWRPVALFLLSAFTYEATLPMALAAWLWANQHNRRRAIIGGASIFVPVLPVLLEQWHKRVTDWVPPLRVVASQLTMNQFANSIFIVIGLVGFSVVAITLYGTIRERPAMGSSEWLIAIGVLVVVIGALPFMSSDSDSAFIGFGDRANLLCSIGAAMLWLGVIERLVRSKRFVVPVVVALCLACIPITFEKDRFFSRLGDNTNRAARLVVERGAGSNITLHAPTDTRYWRANTNFGREVTDKLSVERPDLHVVDEGAAGPDLIIEPSK